MRMLAVSDIHNRIECVHELRRREANEYAAVVVAGDIGADRASEIFEVLESFECPVAYIGGNWDFKLPKDADFGPEVRHLPKGPLSVGGWHLAGVDYPVTADQMSKERAELASVVGTLPANRTIVVSHDRLTRTSNDMPGVALFLYGHMHKFEDKRHRGSRFVNVSALGEVTTLTTEIAPGPKGYRNALRGSYVAIDCSDNGDIHLTPKRFRQATEGWRPVGATWPAAPPLDPSDYPFVDD